MISVGTSLYVSDNSGAVSAYVIKILGNNQKVKGRIGDFLIVAIKKVKPNKKISRHQVKRALLLGTVFPTARTNGISVSFAKNSVVLVDEKSKPLSNRINQFVFSNLRIKNYMKIVSISLGIV